MTSDKVRPGSGAQWFRSHPFAQGEGEGGWDKQESREAGTAGAGAGKGVERVIDRKQ
jgi:hypothetical protein